MSKPINRKTVKIENYRTYRITPPAELDSFKAENETLLKNVNETTKELKATKELNFSLARKITTAPKEDAETTLYNFMKGFK